MLHCNRMPAAGNELLIASKQIHTPETQTVARTGAHLTSLIKLFESRDTETRLRDREQKVESAAHTERPDIILQFNSIEFKTLLLSFLWAERRDRQRQRDTILCACCSFVSHEDRQAHGNGFDSFSPHSSASSSETFFSHGAQAHIQYLLIDSIVDPEYTQDEGERIPFPDHRYGYSVQERLAVPPVDRAADPQITRKDLQAHKQLGTRRHDHMLPPSSS